jgi:hypothetical protein
VLLNLIGTDLIPLGFAAVRILGADAAFNGRIDAAGSSVIDAAVTVAAAGAAILSADGAVLVGITVSVPAKRVAATAETAIEFLDFGDADAIPLVVAAIGILSADAVLNGWIVTAGCVVIFTAVAVAPAAIAVRNVPVAGAFAVTNVVAAPAARVIGLATVTAAGVSGTSVVRLSTAAGATAELLDFVGADAIPLTFAAIGILCADAVHDRGVVTSWRAVTLAAISIRRTDAAA